MKKTYSKSSRQGLPGGPNEMFQKVKGIIVSERGQWDFPGMNTLVPTQDGRITMRGVPYPVLGQDETGYTQMMYPGQEYQFPGQNVLELPMAQRGGVLPKFQSAGEKDEETIEEPKPFELPKGKGYFFSETGETNLPKRLQEIEKRRLTRNDFQTEEDYVNFLTSNKSKFKDFSCRESGCAEFANNRSGELVGLGGADYARWIEGGKYEIGAGGHAWQTYGNLLSLGGKSIFNNYKKQGDIFQAKPGDIVGLKGGWSVYDRSNRYDISGENAPRAGVDNSHQGVVEYVDSKGNVYVRHNVGGKTRVRKIVPTENGYKLNTGNWNVVTIARPNFERYKYADIKYRDELNQHYVEPYISDYNPDKAVVFKNDVVLEANPRRYRTDWGNFMIGEQDQKIDWLTGQSNLEPFPVTAKSGNEDMQKFVDSLNDNKKDLMDYYRLSDDEFNTIAQIAIATAGAESNFGTSSKLALKTAVPDIARGLKIIRDQKYYPRDEMSVGIGQVKPYSLDETFKQIFGIHRRNLKKPEKNALAVFSHLVDDTRKAKRWAERNKDLPEEVRTNYPFLGAAVYVNPWTVATGNLTYDESWQNNLTKPYEAIGLDNQRLRTIWDYLKDIEILDTSKLYRGQPLEEIKITPQEKYGGPLPKAQTLGQFNPELFRPNPLTGRYNWEQPTVKRQLKDFYPSQKSVERATTNVATKPDPIKTARQINAVAAEERERDQGVIKKALIPPGRYLKPGGYDPREAAEYTGLPAIIRIAQNPESVKDFLSGVEQLMIGSSPVAGQMGMRRDFTPEEIQAMSDYSDAALTVAPFAKGVPRAFKQAGKKLVRQTPPINTPGQLPGSPNAASIVDDVSIYRNLDLEELRRIYHNQERILRPQELRFLRGSGLGSRENYRVPSRREFWNTGEEITNNNQLTPQRNISERVTEQYDENLLREDVLNRVSDTPDLSSLNYPNLGTLQLIDKISQYRQAKEAVKKLVNKSGLTKEEALLRAEAKDKDVISKMSEEEFENTVLKPNGEIVPYYQGSLEPQFSGSQNVVPLSHKEYTDEFNSKLDLLNDIIAQKNKSGVEYRVKGLDENGRLVFYTPEQTIKQGDVNVTIPSGQSSWGVRLNPGQWRGNVEDIANTIYFRGIPGLEMSNTTQGVFADNIPRRGTGAYEAINEYLKRLDLGRVKPGFNSQTSFSRGAWENFINSGRAVGFYGKPETIYGALKQRGGAYNMQRALELGYTPDETGHWPSVDSTNGMWLKSKQHPTAWMEYMQGYALNPENNRRFDVVPNVEGYFGENQLQYVPKKFGGSLPTAGDPVLNFIQSQSPRFSKSKK